MRNTCTLRFPLDQVSISCLGKVFCIQLIKARNALDEKRPHYHHSSANHSGAALTNKSIYASSNHTTRGTGPHYELQGASTIPMSTTPHHRRHTSSSRSNANSRHNSSYYHSVSTKSDDDDCADEGFGNNYSTTTVSRRSNYSNRETSLNTDEDNSTVFYNQTHDRMLQQQSMEEYHSTSHSNPHPAEHELNNTTPRQPLHANPPSTNYQMPHRNDNNLATTNTTSQHNHNLSTQHIISVLDALQNNDGIDAKSCRALKCHFIMMEKNLKKLERNTKDILTQLRESAHKKEVRLRRLEWQIVASTIDRVLFIIFFIAIVCSLFTFFPRPYQYQ